MSQGIPRNAIQLHISQLKPGMFVAALDKSWLDTPFPVQGILIKSLADIDALADHTNYVWIDPLQQSLSVMTELRKLAPEQFSITNRHHSLHIPQEIVSLKQQQKHYPKTKDVEEEHATAHDVYERGKLVISEVLEGAAQNLPPDQEKAKNLVKDCLGSILQNPDALLWMIKIREEDHYTAEHCLSVCILALVFGRYLGLSEKNLVQLGLCGLLHDVGKMRVPPDILNKPGALTPEEFAEIKNHTSRGYELLLSIPHQLPSVVAETALGHHERVDGRGYPKKVTSLGLPDMVRIISIVDAYDAITADRCYSVAKSATTALKIIYDERGKQFDEDMALAFIRCIGIYPPGTLVELMNGCVGVVLDVNEKFRHLPRIIVLRDAEGKTDLPYIINLIDIQFGDLGNEYLVKSTLKSGSHGLSAKDYTQRFSNSNFRDSE